MGKGERKLYVCTDDDCTMLSMELLSGESGEGGSAVILFATVTSLHELHERAVYSVFWDKNDVIFYNFFMDF